MINITRNQENLTITLYEWENGSYKIKGWVEGTYIEPIPEPVELDVTEISPRQANIVLLRYNMLDMVESIIDQAGREAKITWDKSTVIKRDNPVLNYVCKNLMNKDDIWIDNMFKEASLL